MNNITMAHRECLKQDKCSRFKYPDLKRKLHAKTAIFDDEMTIVSTYNMDFLSGYVNSEVGALIKSKSFVKEMYESYERDFHDPRNGVIEYRIRRDAKGKAVLKDGKPIVEFGPEDHLDPKILEDYQTRRRVWRLVRKLPWFKPLVYPALKTP